MTDDDSFLVFRSSLASAAAPESCSPLLEAMWWDGKDDWQRAHEIAQDIESEMGSLVHAYLHRREGDLGNASYWYRRAGRQPYHGSLEEEWEAIVRALM